MKLLPPPNLEKHLTNFYSQTQKNCLYFDACVQHKFQVLYIWKLVWSKLI